MEYILYWQKVKDYRGNTEEKFEISKNKKYLERRKREIEKNYLPWRDYAGNELLEKGGYWFRQGHIFSNPFYYIDYTLAQVCALQFWIKQNENKEKAWSEYVRLCEAGGSKSFLKLVEVANLKNPFVDGTIASVIPQINDYLDKVDDKKL